MCSKAEWQETAERRLTQVMALKSLMYMIEEALKVEDLERIKLLVQSGHEV